jgi:competence protein ComEA
MACASLVLTWHAWRSWDQTVKPVVPSAVEELSYQIDLNGAEAAELDLLPGLGPTLTARIVEDRRLRGPFRTLSELERVPGMGPRLVEGLGPYVSLKLPGAPRHAVSGSHRPESR